MGIVLLDKSLADKVKTIAEATPYEEVCGVIINKNDDSVQRLKSMANVSDRPWDTYKMSDADVLSLWGEMDANGEYLFAVYHSHVDKEAVPSDMDIQYALDGVHYLIVSVYEEPTTMRSFTIKPDGTSIIDTIVWR